MIASTWNKIIYFFWIYLREQHILIELAKITSKSIEINKKIYQSICWRYHYLSSLTITNKETKAEKYKARLLENTEMFICLYIKKAEMLCDFTRHDSNVFWVVKVRVSFPDSNHSKWKEKPSGSYDGNKKTSHQGPFFADYLLKFLNHPQFLTCTLKMKIHLMQVKRLRILRPDLH